MSKNSPSTNTLYARVCRLMVLDYYNNDKTKADLWWNMHNPFIGTEPRLMIKAGRARHLAKIIMNQIDENFKGEW